jgi:hypothetical protein
MSVFTAGDLLRLWDLIQQKGSKLMKGKADHIQQEVNRIKVSIGAA